jgi:hypothetical protein
MRYVDANDSNRRNLGAEPPGVVNRMEEVRHSLDNDVAADAAIIRIKCKARMVARMRQAGMVVLDDEIF